MKSLMFEAEAMEFPFVQEMPKRERSRLLKVWDHFQEMSKLAEKKGMLVPQRLTAELLGFSPQRVDQLAKEGRLERVQVNGHPFITETSVLAFAEIERKNGRPVKIMGVDVSAGTSEPSAVETAKAAVRFAKGLAGGKKV